MPKIALNGWFRPWMPWAFSVVVLLGSFAVLWGGTLARVDNNCADIRILKSNMVEVAADVRETREDVSYMRGVIETEFGKAD